MGRKRLELFGDTENIRNGWLTIGINLPEENNSNLEEYNSWFDDNIPINGYIGGRYL